MTIAELATRAGITSTAHESQIPFADYVSRKHGDIMTLVGGIIRQTPTNRFSSTTRLIMDFQLGHTFNQHHIFKKDNLQNMEQIKLTKYRDDYHRKGFAFAPVVSNSFGQLGKDLLRFIWLLANFAARNNPGISQ